MGNPGVCPRAESEVTPCVMRAGRLALDEDGVCTSCGISPLLAMGQLAARAGGTWIPSEEQFIRLGKARLDDDVAAVADVVRDMAAAYAESEERETG